ncbi:tyrosine-type recombinase/integrase [Acidocella facilis]|uniref:tyrosine-type recombinase/integrase n=1 Tax=Acidocella facilis TaxID=525 RepID=UPI001F27B21E|nr:site-specific integrase [Acidocella facilis]
MDNHLTLLGGKLQLYRRGNSRFWQCSASVGAKQWRATTKQENVNLATKVAQDWYLGLCGKEAAGTLVTEKTVQDAAEKFTREYEVITEGERSPKWVQGHQIRLRLHLLPFFGKMGLSEVTPGTVQDYRVHRIETATKAKTKPPARSTLHDEVVTLRLVLKAAIRHGWLTHLPDLAPPYKTQGKVVHRPWFSPEEYKQLYTASRDWARNPPQPQYRWNAEQMHDYILFMGNTGLRPDEAGNLQHRDVSIVTNHATGQTILEIEVRGKRGVGFCKSTPGAVRPYERLLNRPKPTRGKQKRSRSRKNPNAPLPVELPEPTDKVFPQGGQLKLFNRILAKAKLKADRDGKPRTAYSLRHTYICLRLMEGADIYQIAKNCRTSVEMIEKHYAAHIKNTLDAAAINVMRPKAAKAAEKMAKAGAGGNGKGKGGGKTGRPERAVRTELVADVDLAPGALTAENTG